VHGFGRYPEARRRFVPVELGQHPDVEVSLSRRLVLEDVPWADRGERVDLGGGLTFLGVREMPRQLVLLWTAHGDSRAPRRIRVGLGARWSTNPATVGPSVYPLAGWRAGEVVRQVVRVPPLEAPGALPLWLEVGGRRLELGRLQPRLLHQERESWYRSRLGPLIRAEDWDRAQRLVAQWRDPALEAGPVLRQVVQRSQMLLSLGFPLQAARQLAATQEIYRSPEAGQACGKMARQAYRQAQEHTRWGRWPLAFASLRVAALGDPGSAWIHRRLEEARSRLPAQGHLVKLLELELARRSLVLEPSVAGVSRVMEAHLALGQAGAAVDAFRFWTRELGPDRRSRFLLASALTESGRLLQAGVALESLLTGGASSQGAAHPGQGCPPWFPLEPLVLESQLRRMRGMPRRTEPPSLPGFRQPPLPLGGGNLLLGRCIHGRPGEPVEVTLYLWQPAGDELALELRFGSKRQRLVSHGERAPLQRVRVQRRLPPATYTIKLAAEGGTRQADPAEIGSITVGNQANFGFELSTYAPWHRRGAAFGLVPVMGRSARWRSLYGYEGERYADSFAAGFDQATGTLTSPPFLLTREYLMLLVAGGDDPELGVDLVVDGARRLTVRGDRSEILRLHFVPVARWKGRRARVVVRDGSRRPWGHLAVDEIRQLDGPLPGIAP
jgi:hypothetical protein